MDSMKNKNSLTLTVCSRDYNTKNKKKLEDFRSKNFRGSAIIVEPLLYTHDEKDDNEPPNEDTHDEKDDNEPPNEDSTYPIIWCNDEIKHKDISWCSFCIRMFDDKINGYYLSGKLDQSIHEIYVGFHKECIEPMAKNPYHPKHSLYILTYWYQIPNIRCYCCYCDKQSFRYCSICDFRICSQCVQEQPLLTIDHTKRHEHTLSYIPREASMTCDVCGLADRRYFIYICHHDFVVHKECIYFPRIIKISRHEHRLSFNSSILPRKWFCGICREHFDENYGGYLCAKGCSYVVHSKCAIYNNVWDGNELEREQEDTFEDTMPLKEISDGIIQHFSHHHYMRLHKDIDKAYEEKHCQVCALPLYDGDIFSCMECAFVLHKICAYLPLKMQHAMHPHPLILQEGNIQTLYQCSACQRVCNSFQYKCESRKFCFSLDVHCASISEPVDHHCHIHLLFLPSKPGSTAICSICQAKTTNHLECGECNFALCVCCATLPKRFMYKHDEHLVILSFQQDVNGEPWCDVCEQKINPKHGIYMCNECGVTLHIKCLLGEDMYMLPGKKVKGETINDILLNNHLTRDICKWCHKRCQNKIIYKSFDGAICCSFSCQLYQEKTNYVD